ncbi:uncharacterized protein [Pagrus major]|uniref:uncharacterized protein n=1 Tax=Pagrus major TaxID=143350 RepID=UPI003CC8CAC1
MSKVQTLRVFVKQRLTAAAEEIFELFERTIAEYEEELGRHRKLLDAVFKPQVQLHRADVQQLLVNIEDPPEQQEWSSSLDQEDPPELPHIKEEQEELWTSQEGEQLGGLEEADITKFTFTPVPVKSEEDDEEEPQSSQLHQIKTEEIRDGEHLKTEADGEDCGGPGPDRNFNPDTLLQPAARVKVSHSEPESDDSWDWEDTRKHQSGSNALQHNKAPVSDVEGGTGVRPFGCSVCGKRYRWKNSLTDHMRLHSEEKRFSCSVCETSFHWRRNLVKHMKIHAGKKPFRCSVCGMKYARSVNLTKHLEVHTGEQRFTCSICKMSFDDGGSLSTHMSLHTGSNPFSCSVCKKTFQSRFHVVKHMRIHTGEKPFRCSLCGRRFAQNTHLKRHSIVHTGEKSFSCSVCGKRFTQKSTLTVHLGLHTGEKPHTCSICKKSFSLRKILTAHMRVHTGEKPFSCRDCGKRFARKAHLRRHMTIHRGETVSLQPLYKTDPTAHIRGTDVFSGGTTCRRNMSKVQTLRVFVKQRLTAAAEEIFELFERTIAEYEEELGRHRKLLDAAFKPQVQLHRAVSTDVQQLSEGEEEDPPEQQERSSSLDQEDPPELPHIKEEQEELWTSQEGEQLGGLEEADITTFTPDPVKSEEDDEEKPQSSQLHQRQTEEIRDEELWTTGVDGEDCGGPESARIFNPDSHLQPAHVKISQYSEPETDDSYDWEETREHQSGSDALQNHEVSVSDVEYMTGTTLTNSYECATSFGHGGLLQNQVSPFICSICGKRYPRKSSLGAHMRLHVEGKRFSCPVCKKGFQWRRDVVTHMRSHTGEKPFSCLVCGIRFARKEHLNRHSKVHTGEKPFSCSVCGKRFARNAHLRRHSTIHKGKSISLKPL